jgi:beta-lactamase class C
MNKTRWAFFALIISSIYLPFGFAQNTLHHPLPTQVQQFIDKLEADEDNLQGGAVAVLHYGQVVYKNTFGHRRGKEGAVTSKTLFPLASVSKPVSATALALLVQEGVLNLSETYQLPYLKYPVNLKHILSHTTGYKFSGNVLIERGLNRQKLLQQLKYHPPSCEPGGCYLYSNTTYSLIEEVLETKHLTLNDAIVKLRTALQTEGIQVVPLNPTSDVAYPHFKGKVQVGRKLVTHVSKKSKQGKKNLKHKEKYAPVYANGTKTLPFPPYYPKAAPAAAGVFASLDGMIELFKLQFGYRPDLISSKTLEQFYQPMVANNDFRKWNVELPHSRQIQGYYGLGWRILRSHRHPDKDIIFHGGAISGIRSFVGYIPSEKIGVIILLNQNSGGALKRGLQFWGNYIS